jgi:hypothetical protein
MFSSNIEVTIISLMDSGKKEISDKIAYSRLGKKSRLKKLAIWLSIDLVAASVVIALLLYKPGNYSPAFFDSGNIERGQVSPYLTHDLSPQIYNGSQHGEPFDLTVTQDGINEIIAWSGWPKESEGVILSEPAVLFEPESIVLMGKAVVKGVDFIVTIVVEPRIDEQKFLSLRVSKVKIGAMNITPFAKMMAKKMYEQSQTAGSSVENELQTKIVASLLNDKAFEPVFKIEGRKYLVEKIVILNERLIVHLAPSS